MMSLFRSIFLIVLLPSFVLGDEGMYPLSELHKLDLKKKGLRVSAEEIWNPGDIGLIDAIVQVGGCTGSFVSPEGLIITNHHCAFGAVQAVSTTENDYITDGFLASSRAEELRATGISVRITESYRDVSAEVLAAATDTMELAERTRAIEKKIKELVAEAEASNPGKRAEVAEMFPGMAYTLFMYGFIKDVRLVYVPPRSIGEFGGEDDNWVWPRHTGDFSFLRAYVAPDGSGAEYSAENVPYVPRKFLKVRAEGADEGDAVFILGYPGRTFRHRTSHYLSYEEDVRMPYVADLYQWQISTMEELGKHDRSVAIKHDARVKSLANVMKNYRGKLKGLKRLGLVQKKENEEAALQEFIRADESRNGKYGKLLGEIGKMYDEMRGRAQAELTLDFLRSSSTLLGVALTLREASRELQKPDIERDGPFMARNFSRTTENVKLGLRNYHEPTDKRFLTEMLNRASRLPAGQRIDAVDSILAGTTIDRFIEDAYANSRLNDESFVMAAMSFSPAGLDSLDDPLLNVARSLVPVYDALKVTRQRREGALSPLMAELVEVKRQFLKKDFIPDANSTLRLTFGQVKGYSPADALYASPITTLKGVIDKTRDEAPYNTPQKLIDLYRAKTFGAFRHKRLNDVPVAILYNLDTTGGNSGSPLLNAEGELVGVNFDRAYEATVNDYAWSADYSRSIAVDIRYVLWVTQFIGGAGHLLEEMGVQ